MKTNWKSTHNPLIHSLGHDKRRHRYKSKKLIAGIWSERMNLLLKSVNATFWCCERWATFFFVTLKCMNTEYWTTLKKTFNIGTLRAKRHHSDYLLWSGTVVKCIEYRVSSGCHRYSVFINCVSLLNALNLVKHGCDHRLTIFFVFFFIFSLTSFLCPELSFSLESI